MIIYDLTMPIKTDMPVFKNRDINRPILAVDRSHEVNHICEHRLTLNLHTGTHLDAPLHVLPDGATIDTFPLDRSSIDCQVFDLTAAGRAITAESLQHLDFRTGAAVLFKTINSGVDQFDGQFCYVTADGAAYLAMHGLFLVGIDSLGIERDQPGHPSHKALFAAGTWILEGLRLAAVPPGDYILHLLPLLIDGAEASPVRAVLTTR
jgi:arylformamidase